MQAGEGRQSGELECAGKCEQWQGQRQQQRRSVGGEAGDVKKQQQEETTTRSGVASAGGIGEGEGEGAPDWFRGPRARHCPRSAGAFALSSGRRGGAGARSRAARNGSPSASGPTASAAITVVAPRSQRTQPRHALLMWAR